MFKMYSKYFLPFYKENKINYRIYSILINDKTIYNNYLKLYKEWKTLNKNITVKEYNDIKNKYKINYNIYYDKINEIIDNKIKELGEKKQIILENINDELLMIDTLISEYRLRNISREEFKFKIDLLVKYFKEFNLFTKDTISKFLKIINNIII